MKASAMYWTIIRYVMTAAIAIVFFITQNVYSSIIYLNETEMSVELKLHPV
jgi:hypothetical protein